MTTVNMIESVSYEQFREAWLAEIEESGLSPLDKGRRFASKLVTQWLGVTTDDDDFVICDGAGDGGIDVAYLKRADTGVGNGDDNAVEGDTWYLFQSKYGTAFTGVNTIIEEGRKVIATLQGQNQNLSEDSRQLLQKLDLFRQQAQASEADRITLVFATTDPISPDDRQALDDIKLIGRQKVMPNFDVEDISLQTIWDVLESPDNQPRLSVRISGQFVEQSDGWLVGTVGLVDLFEFLKAFQKETGDLNQLYEKNVRQFLGGRRKINKGIADTLKANPEKFGLYNNSITIVTSDYRMPFGNGIVSVDDPYVVNGCQTTKTIWQVLDQRLNAGGTGSDTENDAWKDRVRQGGLITKIVRSDAGEIAKITRYTNSQNHVRERDFLALEGNLQHWKDAMASEHNIFLEIQRGSSDAQRAYEKQHPEQPKFAHYANAFDLIKVYGAGWLGSPGTAFGKNEPFLPGGSLYERIISRQEEDTPFGVPDLHAAYKIQCVADDIRFGRQSNLNTRRQSRFLFYHVIMRMLHNVILLTPELHSPNVSSSVLTDAVLKLTKQGAETQFEILRNAALAVIDQYLTPGGDNSAQNEESLVKAGSDMGSFLKADRLGTPEHSPLLVQLLAQYNQAFASIPMLMYEGNPTQRAFVAQALLDG